MAEQLVFELAQPEPPTFANFLPGPNGEALALLQRVAAGHASEASVVLWGGPGVGKTHLLEAAVDGARIARRSAALVLTSAGLGTITPDAPPDLLAIDDVDKADEVAQGRLFTLYNAITARGGRIIAAAAVPPARLALRDDLRTRLGSGLVFEVMPLPDADLPVALERHARERGFALPPEVVTYLLSYGRRDMRSLLATLAALDRYSLATRRPITLPLLKEWRQRELKLPR
jgi:DnaA family protein